LEDQGVSLCLQPHSWHYGISEDTSPLGGDISRHLTKLVNSHKAVHIRQLVTMLGAVVRYPTAANDFYFFRNVQTASGIYPVIFKGYRGHNGRDVTLTFQSSAEVKNKWSYTSQSPILLVFACTDISVVFFELRRSMLFARLRLQGGNKCSANWINA
jgi:hypothetical protein